MKRKASEGFRPEHDSMGEVLVPIDAWYGAQTERAIQNFPVSGVPLPPSLLAALARIKQAAAKTNVSLRVLDAETGAAIADAAKKVAAQLDLAAQDAGRAGNEAATERLTRGHVPSRGAAGNIMDQFPVDIFQTGSGTSTNMNMNEVLAHLASETLGRPVHPNDHVNASQSSNDVFPSAIHLAAGKALHDELLPALGHLEEAFTRKAAEFAEVVKAGRTHLMDATPVTLGQEFDGYAAAIERCHGRLAENQMQVAHLPLGGTAVGTGINAPHGFAKHMCQRLGSLTGLHVTEADNHFAAHWSRNQLIALSGDLRALAVVLTKICNDLRWMGSGPNAGLGEINLPDLQPGSSIMPGKVNPVVPESVLMVCSRVIGNDATVAWAGASGNFELNVQLPILAACLLESMTLLTNATNLLAAKCVKGITANVERCAAYAGASPAIVTALNPLIGYEKATEVAKHAVAHRITIRDAVLELGLVEAGLLTEAQLDQKLDLLAMTKTTSRD